MKHLSSLLLLPLLSVVSVWRSPVPASAEGFPIDDLMKKPVALKVAQASIDDYLVELAKASDVNVIADATEMPLDTPPTSVDQRRPLGNLIIDFVKPNDVAVMRFDATTLLFWHERDVMELARSIIAKNKVAKNRTENNLTSKARLIMLTDYFEHTHGWDGTSSNVDVRINLSELPPPIRTLVIEDLQRRLSAIGAGEYVEQWFQAPFWSRARLTIGRFTEREVKGVTPVPYLFVGGMVDDVQHKSISSRIGRLEALAHR